ncbi:MAG TPA: RNA-binding transcriptional accessory protein [Saprospirales bacterium]|nr:RNA-binding transcriptional accessory protein [Saprospirales bacterium]
MVYNVLKLIEEGSSIPFIARYRKESTGNMDETVLFELEEQFGKLKELEKRKEFILKSIEDQGKLTPALKKQIEESYDAVLVEDLYLPFKRSNKTKAAVAREKGLEPLAKYIFDQIHSDILRYAGSFVNEKVETVEEAVQGALDIIAEWISEQTEVRNFVRKLYEREAVLNAVVVKGKEVAAQKYKDYFNYDEKLSKMPSHRLLAVFRAENEKLLKIKVVVDDTLVLSKIKSMIIRRNSPVEAMIERAVEDSYKRLIVPSIDNETRGIYKEKADLAAIDVFEKNLRQLLLAAPVGQRKTLAIDPGFRTGCKVVCLADNGDLLDEDVIYPHPPSNKLDDAEFLVRELISGYGIEVIAVGNGTAGKETFQWLKTIPDLKNMPVYLVNEDGASIYSASKTAKDEFPDKDVTVRGAISIGRRLMDPLAELVKIDPKAIGVGQYQYDVNQTLLKEKLDKTVMSAVNSVGINLNTASEHLLSYVSGLGPGLAKNIVKFRSEKGRFTDKKQLMKVSRLGEKAFEQAAGFLRIKGGSYFLDDTGIHPESYPLAEKLLNDHRLTIEEIRSDPQKLKNIQLGRYVNEKTGMPTLKDIIKELEKPGLDPRGEQKEVHFDERVNSIEDLYEGMVLKGIVNNITNFGAFINIGIKEKGMVHISEMANKFVKDPNTIVSLNQEVLVKVIHVDPERSRVQLSMKDV